MQKYLYEYMENIERFNTIYESVLTMKYCNRLEIQIDSKTVSILVILVNILT